VDGAGVRGISENEGVGVSGGAGSNDFGRVPESELAVLHAGCENTVRAGGVIGVTPAEAVESKRNTAKDKEFVRNLLRELYRSMKNV
jgi:hypothetical protein